MARLLDLPSRVFALVSLPATEPLELSEDAGIPFRRAHLRNGLPESY